MMADACDLERCWVHVDDADGSGRDYYYCCDPDSGCLSCCSSVLLGGLSSSVQAEAIASAGKLELHRVLNAFQHSSEYGVHVCETFKDPRRYVMDTYWDEVREEAFSIDELHHLVGGVATELTDTARARLHQFSRALERLSKRIDRVVLATTNM